MCFSGRELASRFFAPRLVLGWEGKPAKQKRVAEAGPRRDQALPSVAERRGLRNTTGTPGLDRPVCDSR